MAAVVGIVVFADSQHNRAQQRVDVPAGRSSAFAFFDGTACGIMP